MWLFKIKFRQFCKLTKYLLNKLKKSICVCMRVNILYACVFMSLQVLCLCMGKFGYGMNVDISKMLQCCMNIQTH